MTQEYTVIVGNIGTVWSGNGFDAKRVYGEYKRMSIDRYGRAAGESVTLMRGDDTVYEHLGTMMEDMCDG